MGVLTPEQLARRRHRDMLIIAGLIVVLAATLQVRQDQRVIAPGFSEYPLPHTCMSQLWFSVKCPGCGLTRSFIYLAHGDIESSLRLHRFGWLMALAVILQFPYRLIALARDGRPVLSKFTSRLCSYILIGVLIGNWLVEMVAISR